MINWSLYILLVKKCGGRDSNPRKPELQDLESRPFGHSGTPAQPSNQHKKLKTVPQPTQPHKYGQTNTRTMRVSISLGGSLLAQTPDAITKYADTLIELKERGHQLIVVTGGGRSARHWISLAKELGADPYTQDRLGIHATHLNALLLIAALGSHAHPHIHRRGSEIKRHLDNQILVGGGYLPGSSTDYRAVLFAQAAKAELIVNATNVDGVYDRNPNLNPDAVKLLHITYYGLEKIINENAVQAPGKYGLFDLKAVKRAKKFKLPLIFVDGTNPKEIARAIEGGHNGTEVR